MAYFPMFVDLADKSCLVVGGGSIAYRKAVVLLDFGARVTVVSPFVCEEIKQLSVEILYKAFELEDIEGMELVVCACNDSLLNHEISVYCKGKKIPVNVVDKIEDCSFIFPSYVKQGELVGAFSSGGKSPMLTQLLRDGVREQLTPFFSELNDYLGSVRNEVSCRTDSEEQRKHIYKRLYELAVNEKRIPYSSELEEIISNEI